MRLLVLRKPRLVVADHQKMALEVAVVEVHLAQIVPEQEDQEVVAAQVGQGLALAVVEGQAGQGLAQVVAEEVVHQMEVIESATVVEVQL